MAFRFCLGLRTLRAANIELSGADDRALHLRQSLDPIKDQYDLIFSIAPPPLICLLSNVLSAAETLIVPMQAEYFALEGISELISTLERVRSAYNPDLAIEGVLLTMYDDRTNLAQQVTETLREHFGEIIYHTVIPRNVRLAEAPSHGKPVAIYDPRSRGAEAYFEMAGEFMARNQIESPRAAERRAAAEREATADEPPKEDRPRPKAPSGLTPDRWIRSSEPIRDPVRALRSITLSHSLTVEDSVL